MGKAGNAIRKQAKRERKAKDKLTTTVQAMLQSDDQEQKAQAVAEQLAMEESILGPQGVPKGFEDNVRHVDFLGRKLDAPKPTLKMYSPQEMRGRLGSAAAPARPPVPDNPILLPPKQTEEEPLLPKRRVTLVRDHPHEYPQLCLNIYVAGDWEVRNDESRFAQLFARALCHKANSIEDADLVVFGGGSDVDPALYGEEVHPKTFFNAKRDEADIKIYHECLEKGVPMFGVCRGAQFLHVMNGGKLWQHVDNHVGDHAMWDLRSKLRLDKISSVHHQACMRNENGMEIIATSSESMNREANTKTIAKGRGLDVEAFWYANTACFGVQGHPEYFGYGRYSKWCLDTLEELICQNNDIDYFANAEGNQRRRLLPPLVELNKQIKGKKGKK
jgi:gamma-glutamyl-gamma-aminobutyrate hydrolase PuuD